MGCLTCSPLRPGGCAAGAAEGHREELAVVENLSPGRREKLGGSQKGREDGQTLALPGRQLGLRAPSGAFQKSVPPWALGSWGRWVR